MTRLEAVSPDKADIVAESGKRAKPSRMKSVWVWARRSIAVLVIGTGSVLTALSYWDSQLAICRVSTGGTVYSKLTSCNPWTLTDLAPFLIVGVLLLLPDLTEIDLFSVISLKRQVQAQKADLEVTARRQDSLEMRLVAQSMAASSATVHNYYQSAASLPGQIDRKDPHNPILTPALNDTSSLDPSNDQRRELDLDFDPDYAKKAMALLRQWEVLQPYVTFRRPSPSSRKNLVNSKTWHEMDIAAQRFVETFADEISTVRAVRNSIAHDIRVDPADLEGALNAAVRLTQIASSSFDPGIRP